MNPTPPPSPVTEAELHGLIDGQLPAERHREVQAWLDARPAEARRMEAYRAQKRELRALFDPIVGEPLPPRLRQAARPPARSRVWRHAASVVIALAGAAGGWILHGIVEADDGPAAVLTQTPVRSPDPSAEAFAQRAMVAHAVYTPEQRRPVEVDAAHEEQLVTWLSRRLGARLRAPQLQSLGYALEGGRLLPGGQGPVAQLMYRRPQAGDAERAPARLTLYISDEAAKPPTPAGETAFHFLARDGINTFYWIDGGFGYALSGLIGREELAGISSEVYRQLTRGD